MQVCDAPQPAFRLELSSTAGVLPRSLQIEVGFGGAQLERYSFESPAIGDVVCCASLSRLEDAPERIPCHVDHVDAGSRSAPYARDAAVDNPTADHVVCDLWTEGAAEVTVFVEGTERFQQTLSARSEDHGECGLLETVNATLMLGDADAGIVAL